MNRQINYFEGMNRLDDKREPAMDVRYFQAYLRKQLARIRATVNQDTVAEAVGISGPYLSDIKNGKKPGTIDVRSKIAEYFSMSLEEFIIAGKQAYEDEVDVAETRPDYGPAQYNFFGNRKTDLQPSDDYMEEYPKLVGYLDAFRSACKVGSKRLMLGVLEELKEYIEGEDEE